MWVLVFKRSKTLEKVDVGLKTNIKFKNRLKKCWNLVCPSVLYFGISALTCWLTTYLLAIVCAYCKAICIRSLTVDSWLWPGSRRNDYTWSLTLDVDWTMIGGCIELTIDLTALDRKRGFKNWKKLRSCPFYHGSTWSTHWPESIWKVKAWDQTNNICWPFAIDVLTKH